MKIAFKKASDIFRMNGGVLRMSEALRRGVSRYTLYAMRDAGVIELLSRGVYRLTELPGSEAPDLVTVAVRVPRGVICLVSALAYHELTTQVPHAIDIAIERGCEPPRVKFPPINIYWFSGTAFTDGIETHSIDGVDVRIYGVEKSIVDVFKYRNKLGLNIALEALQTWCRLPSRNIENLLDAARTCRVENVIRPYLEALL
ncbi:MAG: transcriptional regulator [Proteobacteria bacterium]|nr:transcriptional regulator [Pseudomonadota bacterium]